MNNILITGAAGFIGMHLIKELVQKDYNVYGIDNLNSYYSVELKVARLAELGIFNISENEEIKSSSFSNFCFRKMDILQKENLLEIFKRKKFDFVIHLAAQAGVRYSISNPDTYVQSNIVGFYNILEACRTFPVKHLLFASSSSVYGLNKKGPFSTDHDTDQPISLYAASKKSNEIIAHSYSHLFKIPCTGLRFFTVYGPWYRPDMAMFIFANAIFAKKPMKIFNNGQLQRDFTYVGDVTKGIEKLIRKPPTGDLEKEFYDNPFYRLLNIGNSSPVPLMEMIETLEKKLGEKAIKEFLPMQAGDVEMTYADVDPLNALTGFKPTTTLDVGIKEFAEWYKAYFKIEK